MKIPPMIIPLVLSLFSIASSWLNQGNTSWNQHSEVGRVKELTQLIPSSTPPAYPLYGTSGLHKKATLSAFPLQHISSHDFRHYHSGVDAVLTLQLADDHTEMAVPVPPPSLDLFRSAVRFDQCGEVATNHVRPPEALKVYGCSSSIGGFDKPSSGLQPAPPTTNGGDRFTLHDIHLKPHHCLVTTEVALNRDGSDVKKLVASFCRNSLGVGSKCIVVREKAFTFFLPVNHLSNSSKIAQGPCFLKGKERNSIARNLLLVVEGAPQEVVLSHRRSMVV